MPPPAVQPRSPLLTASSVPAVASLSVAGQLRADELVVGPGEAASCVEQDVVGGVTNPPANRLAVEHGCLVCADACGIRDRRRSCAAGRHIGRDAQRPHATAACSRSRAERRRPIAMQLTPAAGNGAPVALLIALLLLLVASCRRHRRRRKIPSSRSSAPAAGSVGSRA